MSKHPKETSKVSKFMRALWAAEAECPVFAGSVKNVKLLWIGTKPQARRPAKALKQARTTATA